MHRTAPLEEHVQYNINTLRNITKIFGKISGVYMQRVLTDMEIREYLKPWRNIMSATATGCNGMRSVLIFMGEGHSSFGAGRGR